MNYMNDAIKEAILGIQKKDGGPFGCVIVKDGKIISISHNTVLKDNDPTAHAEVNAIRDASKKLNTYDLTGCILYSTCEPCPMCLSAIIWSNIKEVYYGCNKEDANKIGFRDDLIYKHLNNELKLIDLKSINREECLDLLSKYDNVIY